jgi:hypothetical protein
MNIASGPEPEPQILGRKNDALVRHVGRALIDSGREREHRCSLPIARYGPTVRSANCTSCTTSIWIMTRARS